MSEYRYTLERGSKKHFCPNCGKKTFVQYIDRATSEYLPPEFGRCDRESKCGYHKNPYRHEYNAEGGTSSFSYIPPPPDPPVHIPYSEYKRYLNTYQKNQFLLNLQTGPYPMNEEEVRRVIELYYLGTISSGKYEGAICFPFINKHDKIRAVQVKQFDKQNHTTNTTFLHYLIEPRPDWFESYNNQEKKVSCLFGEHLLKKYPHNPVALVEAPKTAILGTLFFGLPENETSPLWLAVFNLSSLKYKKVKSLEGRKVFLYPDLSKDGSSFDLWNKKAQEFNSVNSNMNFTTSKFLEERATPEERERGLDLADYLVRFDWRVFRT